MDNWLERSFSSETDREKDNRFGFLSWNNLETGIEGLDDVKIEIESW